MATIPQFCDFSAEVKKLRQDVINTTVSCWTDVIVDEMNKWLVGNCSNRLQMCLYIDYSKFPGDLNQQDTDTVIAEITYNFVRQGWQLIISTYSNYDESGLKFVQDF
jgi:hypothetical protein